MIKTIILYYDNVFSFFDAPVFSTITITIKSNKLCLSKNCQRKGKNVQHYFSKGKKVTSS